jgi:hypothetical protein
MRIGYSAIPRITVPAFLKGNLTMLDLANLHGRWGIICGLPPIEFCEAVFLNQYHRTVNKNGAMLLGMFLFGKSILDPHLPMIKVLGFPLLADHSGRLGQVLGSPKNCDSNRCQSFIFDPQGVIRYHLVHVFNWRGFSFLGEILKHCQDLYPQPTKQVTDHPFTNLISSEETRITKTMPPRLSTGPLESAGGTYFVTERAFKI